jgi:hypothetical protein
VLGCFCNATGLKINEKKTTFLQFGLQQNVLENLKAIYHYNVNDLSVGFRYLGYFLKIERYRTEDWQWLVDKYECRISHWCNRWLTIGGRLILIKAVLESQPVYWLSLTNLPSRIHQRIHHLIFSFLWSGCKKQKKIHLCDWKLIARPKLHGGWGLRNLVCFSRALATNTLWRALMHEGLWHRILKDKYFPFISVARWLHTINVMEAKGSKTWKYLLNSVHIILHWLAWRPGT